MHDQRDRRRRSGRAGPATLAAAGLLLIGCGRADCPERMLQVRFERAVDFETALERATDGTGLEPPEVRGFARSATGDWVMLHLGVPRDLPDDDFARLQEELRALDVVTSVAEGPCLTPVTPSP